MKQFFCVTAMLLRMKNARAFPFACQKFFMETDARMTDIRDEKNRRRVHARRTTTKNKMPIQIQNTQAKAVQNGLLTLRHQVK
ncbi:hypothetical protein [Exercitatus varius]|uniref:hypothetical protein n=1 Tax=Exercitatus varius TaxID=67857 RepID=UPI00294AAF72|nr:hypothetical protein [Exercitatus varius]MDG2957163.1 hypothetical protein [Exercitatus varius]